MSVAAEPDGGLLGRIRMLQLASPALPIGGYSYSSGLEWAVDSGAVNDDRTAFAWIDDALCLVLGRFDAPLLVAAVSACEAADHARLAGLNRLALAARETAELRLESEQMGYSLARWIAGVAGEAGGAGGAGAEGAAGGAAETGWMQSLLDPNRPLAAVVAWAIAAWRLGLGGRDAVTGFLWSFVENQVTVLIKTVPMGQIQAQRLLYRLGPQIGAAVESSLRLPQEAWSNAAPGLAIASMAHESQYSRLFRS